MRNIEQSQLIRLHAIIHTSFKLGKSLSHLLLNAYHIEIKPRQYGGGQRSKKRNPINQQNDNELTEIISVSSTSIDKPDEWRTHSSFLEVNEYQLTHDGFWHPPIPLPIQPNIHPLCSSIPPNLLESIKTICNFPPEIQILRSTHKPNISIMVGHMQDLVSYGSETNDAILTLYLELLCSNGHATYMSTAFWPHMQQYGWNHVQQYFATSQTGYYSRKIDRPYKTGEPKIMIPLFIHGTHWVALVHRESNG